jgi:hypothetical protein
MDMLQHLGAPPLTEIGIDINYASVIFAAPNDAPMPWKGLMHVGTPDVARGGLVFPIEHRQWMISLGGVHGDIPPGNLEGFTEFARSFRTPKCDQVRQTDDRGCALHHAGQFPPPL